MGRRSRKRMSPLAAAEQHAAPEPEPPELPRRPPRAASNAAPRAVPTVTPRRRPRLDEAPKAPWSPFPLVELCILIAIVLVVLGLLTHGHRARVELAGGFTLMVLSVSELTIREHFAGYRSHSAMLAGTAAVGVDALLFFFTPLPQVLLLVIGASVFGVGFRALRAAFMRRTGGLGFRA